MKLLKVNNVKQSKKSLKPIPPTLRGKKRYVLFQLVAEKQFSELEVKKELFAKFKQLFGDFGIAKQKLWFISFNSQGNFGILRCSLEETENVKAGLLFLQSVNEVQVIPRIVSVSGSLKKLKGKRVN